MLPVTMQLIGVCCAAHCVQPRADCMLTFIQAFHVPSLYGKGLAVVRNKPRSSGALQVAPLWFLAQYTFNTSLNLTSVTSNTILSSTSSLFTYGLSCSLALERLAVRKLAFIILCMAGKCTWVI